MPAVCADKAWHYALLSVRPSAGVQAPGSAQLHEMYLETGTKLMLKGATNRVKQTWGGC